MIVFSNLTKNKIDKEIMENGYCEVKYKKEVYRIENPYHYILTDKKRNLKWEFIYFYELKFFFKKNKQIQGVKND